MEIAKINSILSNQVRLNILQWLKNPEENFPPHVDVPGFKQGVCVTYIKEKSKLSQSTISIYLNQMENANLIIQTRIGKWTYFKRNEETIQKYLEIINQNL